MRTELYVGALPYSVSEAQLQEILAGRCGKNPGATKSRSRTLRHDGKFTLASEIIPNVTFGKELPAQRSRFTLRRNRIRDHQITGGSTYGLFNDFTTSKK